MPYKFIYYNPDETIRFQKNLITERCIHVNQTNGRQCSRKVVIGVNRCFQHRGDLKVKPSLIPDAGKGVFAYDKESPNSNDIVYRPHDKIIDYLGERINKDELNKRYGDDKNTAPYGLKINNNLFIDAATRRGIASLVNKPPPRNQPNARLSVNTTTHNATLKATKNIRNNQEILTSYGNNYVIQDNYKTKYTSR
jgi:hypothetical protein